MLTELPRPTIFAHRGASAYAPENTLAAFELALRQGADAIELDAKLTRDGHIVVIHDQTVDRTTEGRGRVKDMTLAELRKLDAGSHFDVAFQ
jgi:glycerophosphoryl diester phosphodiesterase